MTSRSKNAVRGYETEIEKSREESNWKKAVELAQQLVNKVKPPQHESLAHFLIGEAKLEAYLDEWPPSKENFERAQRELTEARGYLTLATNEDGKRAGVALDAHLLLGKLNYACGSYDDALKHYMLAELNTLTEKELPVRSLRIIAESYAIKGLCLEQNALPGSTSKYKQAEREFEMIRSFELASDLTLLYLQRAQAARAGPTLETALQRVPILHIRAGRLHNAIDRYREMLTAVESPSTHSLRLTLARQLAEVLMRGVTGQVYKAPERAGSGSLVSAGASASTLPRRKDDHAADRPWKPNKYAGINQVYKAPERAGSGSLVSAGASASTLPRRKDDHAADRPWKPNKYAGINQFIPRNEYEEVVLVLLVGEAMAVRDAVLSQSAEFEAARAHALSNAVALMDLLALAAARWGQLCLLLESLERAMKFSFGQAHVWRQRTLATAAAAQRAPAPHHAHAAPGSAGWGAAIRARNVAARAVPLVPQDAALRLVAANTCYSMGWIEEGIEMAEQALAIEEQSGGPLLARCCLYGGIGHQMKAQKTNSRIEKEAENDASLKLLIRSAQLDDNDHLAFYYLALQYMHLGMLNDAMDATRSCLEARAECSGGLRLATALWSCSCAGGRAPRALSAARLARTHYPRAPWPLWALAALQLRARKGEAALATGKELLTLLNSLETDEEAEADYNGYTELDALSDSQHADDTHSTRDAASVRAESAGAWVAERALSGASMIEPRAQRAAPRAHAWLLLADLCLRLGKVSAATGCVSEAAALTPYSHLVLYTRGLVHAASDEWEEARQCFQNALAIHPTHLDSMVQLGAAYYSLGWLRLAEKWLREAAGLEPARADTWRRLALVLAALRQPAAAADAAAAALALRPTEPALQHHPPL